MSLGAAPAPRVGRHLAGFFEALVEDHLGGLVVEDERSLRIHEQDRHGEAARELPRQDELYGFGQ